VLKLPIFPRSHGKPKLRVHLDFAALDLIEEQHRGHGISIVMPTVFPLGRRDIHVQAGGPVGELNEFRVVHLNHLQYFVVERHNTGKGVVNLIAVDDAVSQRTTSSGPLDQWKIISLIVSYGLLSSTPDTAGRSESRRDLYTNRARMNS
jgi:hypothetical protein